MNQSELADQNVLVSAIHPLRNILLSDGGEGAELISNIVDSEPDLIPGLKELIEGGWKAFALLDEDEDGQDFDDLPEWQQHEILSEWACPRVAHDLLVAAVSAPVPRYHAKRASFSFSWGYCFTGFVAGSTLPELYAAAIGWKERRYQEEKQEQISEAAATA